MYYEGDANNKITIGRDMGWGALSSLILNGNITCTGNINVGVATNYSTATKMHIKGASSGYSQPLVRIEQTAGWDGNYCLQTVGYSDFNGIRINGADTGNTIYTTGANDMGLATNAGAMKFAVNGAERMRIHNNGNVSVSNDFTVNSTLNCSTAYINGNCTAYKYYVAGETYSYTVNWNGTSASGLFVSLNQFWYTGHAPWLRFLPKFRKSGNMFRNAFNFGKPSEIFGNLGRI
jgi:hypothetical protein